MFKQTWGVPSAEIIPHFTRRISLFISERRSLSFFIFPLCGRIMAEKFRSKGCKGGFFRAQALAFIENIMPHDFQESSERERRVDQQWMWVCVCNPLNHLALLAFSSLSRPNKKRRSYQGVCVACMCAHIISTEALLWLSLKVSHRAGKERQLNYMAWKWKKRVRFPRLPHHACSTNCVNCVVWIF